MRKDIGHTSGGETLFYIALDSDREVAALLSTVSRLEIPSVCLADREAVNKKCVRSFLGSRVQLRHSEQGNTIVSSNKEIVVYESPDRLVYSQDSNWMAALTIGIIQQTKDAS